MTHISLRGQFIRLDWRKIVFTSSFATRLLHMVLAAYLTTGLVVGAVGASTSLNTSPQKSWQWKATLTAPR